jgi:hypothetical protein
LIRSCARALVWIGAYALSIWIVAIVRFPSGSSVLAITLPTLTPAIRTSACVPSWSAYGNEARNS